MKHIIIVAFISLILPRCEVISPNNNEIDYLVYFSGQSNMDGPPTTSILDLPSEYSGEFQNIQIWNGSSFEALNTATNNNQYPVDQRDMQFGVEIGSLIDIANQINGTLYCIKYAVPGTTKYQHFSQDWNYLSSGELYDQYSQEIVNAHSWLDSMNIMPIKLAKLEYQGESDCLGTLSQAQEYEQNTIDFHEGINEVIGDPYIRTVLVKINNNISSDSTNKAVVRNAFDSIEANQLINNVSVVTVDEFSIADSFHYDSQNMILVGNKIGAKIVTLIE